MLNELLVLGQIPGTSVQITFNDMVATVCVLYLMHKYIQYAIEIERWYRWTWYRAGVYYRRQKRHLISVIRYKRYRLAVFERRIIRLTKSYLRRQRHTLYMITVYRPYSSLKRHYYIRLVQLVRMERRIRRSRTIRTFISLKDFVSQSG
jgi:hypothetical protein